MKKLLLILLSALPLAVTAQKYKGEYINAAGDDGASDTLFESITFRNDSFQMKCVTREALKASRKAGKVSGLYQKGVWKQEGANSKLEITYYRREAGSNDVEKYVEHYTRKDGDIVTLHLSDGRTLRGIFTKKYYPDMPPMLCIGFNDKNLVFANWSTKIEHGQALIGGK